jgi:hypothetical protein
MNTKRKIKNEEQLRMEIRKNVGELAESLYSLSMKYEKEPLLKDAQSALLGLAIHVGNALDMQMG